MWSRSVVQACQLVESGSLSACAVVEYCRPASRPGLTTAPDAPQNPLLMQASSASPTTTTSGGLPLVGRRVSRREEEPSPSMASPQMPSTLKWLERRSWFITRTRVRRVAALAHSLTHLTDSRPALCSPPTPWQLNWQRQARMDADGCLLRQYGLLARNLGNWSIASLGNLTCSMREQHGAAARGSGNRLPPSARSNKPRKKLNVANNASSRRNILLTPPS